MMLKRIAVSIASGASLSAAFYGDGLALVGIEMPAGWTAAPLTFQMAADDGGAPGTFRDLYDWTGAEFAVAADAGHAIPFDPRALPAVEWIKVRSGLAGSPVNQGGDRTVILVLRSVA